MLSKGRWFNRVGIAMAVGVLVTHGASAWAGTAYSIEWSQQFGTTAYDSIYSIDVDDAGNSYVTGRTEGQLGEAYAGGSDAYLAKYDTAGNELWTRQIGTPYYESGSYVDVDVFGNIYVTGRFGTDGDYNSSSSDVFLKKYDTAGNLIWTRTIATPSREVARSVTTDNLGNVYVMGDTQGGLGGVNVGGYDTFIRKYNAAGAELWTKQFGSSDDDYCEGLVADTAGNVYLGGSTIGLVDPFDWRQDGFLVKLDPSGEQLWSQQISSDEYQGFSELAVDSEGNLYAAGSIATRSNNASTFDAMLRKFDSDGVEVWYQRIGTDTYDTAVGVTVDSFDNIFLTGMTSGDLGGPSQGSQDAFVMMFDTAGTQAWIKQFGSSAYEGMQGIASDAAGNIYVGGFIRESGIEDDALLVKLAIPEPASLSLLTLGGLMMLRRSRKR